jgi:hypothetical protein
MMPMIFLEFAYLKYVNSPPRISFQIIGLRKLELLARKQDVVATLEGRVLLIFQKKTVFGMLYAIILPLTS